MSKVYFKKVTDKSEEKLSKAARELLEVLVKNENHTWEKKVPMKVHFGEKGNTTYIKPACYKDVIEYMGENQIESAYIETNVLYRGSRTTRDSHIELAKEHGFTQLPIIIADGDHGEAYDEIKIDKEYFSTCKIGTEFSKYNQFLVMAHFKGHGSAGFGGAMKQLAMGFAARGGKLAQHSGISPKVIEKKCISCGLCVEKCDVEAIEMKEKAFIHSEKCVGCAGCIAVCPVGAIVNDWSEVNFKEKLAEYAYAAQKGKDNVYITYLINITKECDCMGQHMDEVASDIGVFISKDPVAIDTACIDMLQNQSEDKLFDDGRESIEHAVKIGFGSKDYELIELQ